jgi:hypothetical protein
VGADEPGPLGSGEAPLRYHPDCARALTDPREAGGGTVAGGQFDWGGRLPKGNGGAPRWAQHGWKSCGECKGRSPPDCETDWSSRGESRA